jgi:hypothetical protein
VQTTAVANLGTYILIVKGSINTGGGTTKDKDETFTVTIINTVSCLYTSVNPSVHSQTL